MSNPARIHFETLPPEEKRAAMVRLAITGYSNYAIAAATGQSVESVNAMLRQEREATTLVD